MSRYATSKALGQAIGEIAEAGAEHDGHIRAAEAAAPQELRRFHGPIEVGHAIT